MSIATSIRLHTPLLQKRLRFFYKLNENRPSSACFSCYRSCISPLHSVVSRGFHVAARTKDSIQDSTSTKDEHTAPNVISTVQEETTVGQRASAELLYDESAEEYSHSILDDPISDISLEETSKFIIPYPKRDTTYLFDIITRPFRENYVYEPASMMLHLCVERLENEELTSKFEIGPGFNRRAYFLVLHVWILHRRAMKEIPLGILLDRYLFEFTFELFKEWLAQRKVPEHRFKKEHENCQAFMMKFLVELDQCTLDEDIYPYKIAKAIRYHMYEDDVTEGTLRLLVKYILRQFVHVSNLETKHYLDAMFLWADHHSICKPQRLLKRAMPQLVKYGGYKFTQMLTRTAELAPGSPNLSA